jgi:hypothetical protein
MNFDKFHSLTCENDDLKRALIFTPRFFKPGNVFLVRDTASISHFEIHDEVFDDLKNSYLLSLCFYSIYRECS